MLVMVLSLLSFSNASKTGAEYPIKERDSLYLYYALENQASIEEMLAHKDIAMLLEGDKSLEKSLPFSIRSIYSNKKSEVLDPADFEKALSELTEKQKSAIEQAESALKKVSRKNEFSAVILGNNLGKLEYQLVQIKGLQALLNSMIPKTVDVTTKMQIRDQIETLKDEQKKIEAFINEKADRFSLFGWLVAAI